MDAFEAYALFLMAFIYHIVLCMYNIMLRLVEKSDFSTRDSSVPGAGKGIFAEKDIIGGTILPYNTIVKNLDETSDDDDDTNKDGAHRTIWCP